MQAAKLLRMEEAGCIAGSTISSIKRFVNRDLSGGGMDVGGFLSARRGGERRGIHPIRVYLRLGLHQGRSSCCSRENPNADEVSPVYLMVEWRPLPPLALGTVFRPALDGLYQPPGLVATSEAFACCTVCSPFFAPSGFVPGDEEGDCAAASRCGGEGAGPDCVSSVYFELLCAICRDLFVISTFLESLIVSCNSTAED